jgi:hypothetical protein
MKINTKAVFEWNPKSKQYEEIYCDSYEYDGKVAECRKKPLSSWRNWPDKLKRPQSNLLMSGRSATPWQPQRPSVGMSPQYQRGAQMLEGFQPWEFDPMEFGGQDALSYGGQLEPGSGLLGPKISNAIGLGSYKGSLGLSSPSGDIGNLSGGFSGDMTQEGFGTNKGFLNTVGSSSAPDRFTPDIKGVGMSNAMTSAGPLAEVPVPKAPSGGASGGVSSFMGKYGGAMAMGAGALLGGIAGYGQAKSQKKGLGVAIKELDPLKGKYMQARERQLGLAESYRPGGRYSQYMGGQIMSQAAESAGQESQRMVASGITSPSMMRAMAKQSRATARDALPGMEMQLSQMALPYEQMGAQSLTQYGGVVEQLASLKGSRAAINPWASAISGGMQGAMGASSMMGSFS